MEALATPGRRPNGFGRESVRGTQRMLPMSRPVALTHGARGGSAGPRRSLCASPRPRLASNQLYAWPPDGASWRRPLGPLVAATMIEWRDKRGTNRRRAKPACPRNRTRVRPLRDEPRPIHSSICVIPRNVRRRSPAGSLALETDAHTDRQTDGRRPTKGCRAGLVVCFDGARARTTMKQIPSICLAPNWRRPPTRRRRHSPSSEKILTSSKLASERAREAERKSGAVAAALGADMS